MLSPSRLAGFSMPRSPSPAGIHPVRESLDDPPEVACDSPALIADPEQLCHGERHTARQQAANPSGSRPATSRYFHLPPTGITFEEVALPSITCGQTLFEGDELNTMLPMLKAKACTLGFDAMVLQHVPEDR